jgi:hypothetical protein
VGALPPCPDLDENEVLDCDETLAKNATFDSNAASWAAETGVEVTWDEDDAHGKDDSGSLDLENVSVAERDGLVMLGARQCFDLDGDAVYQIGAEISVREEGEDRQGGFQFIVYSGPLCTGDALHIVNSARVTTSDWRAPTITYLTPTVAQSAAMRFITLKQFRDASVSIRIDNVLVRKE